MINAITTQRFAKANFGNVKLAMSTFARHTAIKQTKAAMLNVLFVSVKESRQEMIDK